MLERSDPLEDVSKLFEQPSVAEKENKTENVSSSGRDIEL